MRLEELYHSDTPDISIELFPPKTPEGIETLFNETVPRLIRLKPAFFSMTYGAAGSTSHLTVELCDRLKNQCRVETMCHLNVVGQSKDQTRQTLKKIQAIGVYNLLALRGDPPRDQPHFTPHPDGFRSSLELIAEAKKVMDEKSGKPWFSIAVTGFPEVHPEAKDRASDIAYLKRKIDAGGCVVITQYFLDTAYFFDFLEHVRQAGITVPVIPGILPILSWAQLKRFSLLCGAAIPTKVAQDLSRYEHDEESATLYGIELATRLCEELLRQGAPGLHFYALNRARSVEAICANLGLLKGKASST